MTSEIQCLTIEALKRNYVEKGVFSNLKEFRSKSSKSTSDEHRCDCREKISNEKLVLENPFDRRPFLKESVFSQNNLAVGTLLLGFKIIIKSQNKITN
jgi:hypothetical protein